MNQLDMQGRHAVITGGAAGLGYAIAQRMLASGATVTLWDRDQRALDAACQALGPQAAGVQVDVASHASVVQAVAKTAQPVDALVNSAGITGPNTTVWNYPVADWEQVMQVNVNGTFFCCRELASRMRDQGWGRIVNIASVAGKDGNPNASAYSASKAAVIGLTKSLGKELAQSGVRVKMLPSLFGQNILQRLSLCKCGKFGTFILLAHWRCALRKETESLDKTCKRLRTLEVT